MATAMQFITVSELKTRLGATSISIVKNPKEGGKIFGNANTGKNIKVQQDLDASKELRYMYEDEASFDTGCLVNVKPTQAPLAVL